MLRTFGKTTAKLRAMAGDFQKQFNEALKEAELDDVKKSVEELRSLNPANEIRKQLNPFEKAAADVRAGLDKAMKPSEPAKPADATLSVTTADTASAVTHAAEPLKNGATAMPGVAGPEAMPAAPVIAATNGAAAGPSWQQRPRPSGGGDACGEQQGRSCKNGEGRKSASETKAPAAKASPAKAAAKPAASRRGASTDTVAAKSAGRKPVGNKPKANPS